MSCKGSRRRFITLIRIFKKRRISGLSKALNLGSTEKLAVFRETARDDATGAAADGFEFGRVF